MPRGQVAFLKIPWLHSRRDIAVLLLLLALLVPAIVVLTLNAQASNTPDPRAGTSPSHASGGIPLDAQTPTSLPILPGSTWSYFKGTVAPPADWNTVDFVDTLWLTGPTGIGYGDGDDATVLGDMQSTTQPPGYVSVYLRRLFDVPDPSAITGLTLTIDYDDGFVAYLNGSEVARRNVSGTPPPYNATATASHEASAGTSGSPAETISLDAYVNLLVATTNVLAIQVHNVSVNSTDLSVIPTLQATNPPPTPPTAPDSPADGATGVATTPDLCVTVGDPNGDSMAVTFTGRPATPSGSDFTIIVLPDTQYYAQSHPDIFNSQTQWIVNNRLSRNIVFVTQVGDCTNDGDTIPSQWTTADAAYRILEDPATTQLPNGIPYGIAVGNHDQTPNGTARSGSNETATTNLYNQWFGQDRFCPAGLCRSYFGENYTFGGAYPDNMDNHYELFSADGLDFIAFHLEWDQTDNPTRQAVLAWMRNVLTSVYPNRRAIITSHYLINPGDTSWSNQGQAVYDTVKDVPNVFLMVSGHLDQANSRTDTFNGHTMHTMVSDYQTRPNGGDGWLRILTFSPRDNSIHVQTYSPWLGQLINNHPDNTAGTAKNDFVVSYDMGGGGAFETIGTIGGVADGGQACLPWPGRQGGQEYEWHVDISDGTSTTTSSTWTFTASCTSNGDCNDNNVCTTDACDTGICTATPIPGCGCNVDADCDNGNVCDGLETCVSGSCVLGTALACTDGNACTADSCDPATGCVYTNTTLACTDGNDCTTGDACSGGACRGAYQPVANCCTSNSDCNDDSPATIDRCTSGACSNTVSAACSTNADCNDGDACTTETCLNADTAALQFTQTAGACSTNGVACTNLGLACVSPGTGTCVGQHVTFGNPAELGLSRFTIETWFKRTGTGTPNTTGGGGITVVPLVTKGAPQAEASNVDANYILGINTAGSVLAADFEQFGTCTGGTGTCSTLPYGPGCNCSVNANCQSNLCASAGLNRPVSGTTPIVNNTWYHAAATYDGTTWRLYLNGNPEATLVVGAITPRFDSIQRAGLGTMLPSGTGIPVGFFQGVLDEVRIWNFARSQADIQNDRLKVLTSGTGMVAHWGLDEGTGTTVADSAGPPFTSGTLTNSPVWTADRPGLDPGFCSYTTTICSDNNPCTLDVCSGGVCSHPIGDDGAACEDGNVCTSGDACASGICQGGAPNTNPCDDGDACTTGDACSNGACAGGTRTCCTADSQCNDGQICTTDSCASQNTGALVFDGTNDYVTFGTAAELGLSQFTLETWFRRTGAGVANTTGTGGITTLVPLIAKGAPEADGSNVDANYILGINTAGNVLAADFEDTATGLNHPLSGTTPIVNNSWYHAAATYDGTTWRLYLNGSLEATLAVGAFTPRFDSIQPAGLGTMQKSALAPGQLGFFAGLMDEVRIWNVARSQADIQNDRFQQVTSGTGLVARWGLNEGPPSTTTADSAGPPFTTGTLTNGPAWETLRANLPPVLGTACANPPAVGESCTDGNACNGAETCDASGQCAPGTPLDCDDSNVCTSDSCDPAGGCVHTSVAGSCDDGQFCTIGDGCSNGACVGTARSCSDGIGCTLDSCDEPGDQCLSADTCPTGQVCNHTTGECEAPPCTGPQDCSDGNACTEDVCNTTTGECSNPPKADGTACDDGIFCTSPDACSAGACSGAPVPDCCVADGDCADTSDCTTDFCPIATNGPAALSFNGSSQYVTMGLAPGLNAVSFTAEGWFRWGGGGTSVSTGSNGITLYPLVTKGSPQADGSNVDENYVLGIRSSNGTLAADFEEGPGGAGPLGNNHPIAGATAVTPDVWHHAAVTYDGLCWKLYLDGLPETLDPGFTACPNSPPRSDSIQHSALGSCLTSTGATNGFFQGHMDEVRIWNRALSRAEILAGKDRELTSGTGLIGRWGLNEGAGTIAADSAAPAQDGTLTNGPTWITTPLVNFGTPGQCVRAPAPNCCVTNADCSDGDACTSDTCVLNLCQHAAVPDCCTTNADCADANACTDDMCLNNACLNNAIPDCCTSDAACGDGDACTADACNTATTAALRFNGTSSYVTMGPAPGLGASRFTLETWFRWTGSGAATGTGSGGLTAIPLIAKGRAEADATNQDMNYFLGIQANKLAGDFEEAMGICSGGSNPGAACYYTCSNAPATACSLDSQCPAPNAGTCVVVNGCTGGTCVGTPGLNHPVFGTTIITTGLWHHAAATYDGTCWRLYLDGALDATNCPGRPPRSDSIQHFGLATGLTSGGGAAGFFAGDLDEVRIWNRALPQAEIQANLGRQVASGAGLFGRWGVDEGTGTSVVDSAAPPENGTIVNGTWLLPAPDLPPVGTNRCEHPSVSCDDGNPCTADSCDAQLGCQHTPTPGAACTDNDACTTGDTCSASGQCVGGPPVVCPTPDQCHDAGTCDPATGLCSNPPKADGTACSDGNACTQTDTCQSGVCTGSNTVTCTASDQCHDAGTCDPATGTCSDPVKPDGATCNDGNACTQTDTCQAGVCTGSNPVVCTASDQCHDPGVCDSATGLCSNPAKPDGTTCSDGNACTTTDACTNGVCVAGPAADCNDDNVCTDDSCDPAVGCQHSNNTASCDDGDVCNGTGVCHDGSCAGTPPPDCDDGNPCTTDSCDPILGCQHVNNTAACDDGDACTVGDACGNGACVPGAPVTCTASDQCHDAGTCDPATGLCSDPAKPDGTACDDGNACTTGDACVGGSCGSGTAPPEICNGIDDDCDGSTDEGNPGGGISCNTGLPGVCAAGTTLCSGGSIVCAGNTGPATANVAVQIDSPMKHRANGATSAIEDTVYVQIDSPMIYLANASDPGVGLAWIEETFDTSGWTSGTYGVGYDTGAAPNALGLIRSSVAAGTFSVFTRTTFTITDVSQVKSLLFGADYDDGYVAYLNGVEVARSSTMPAGDPAWNTNAALHESSNAASPNYGTLIDLSGRISLLHNGPNVLAVGVWNSAAATSTDLVVVPKLSAGLDWTARGYDDASWSNGLYGIGYDGTAAPHALGLIRTTVPTGTLSVFTRAHFTIPDAAALAAIQRVLLGVDYDDGVVAWINGVEVLGTAEMPFGPLTPTTPAALHESSNGTVPNYSPIRDITARARPALVVGDNVLAIGVWNASATSSDLVLVPRLSLAEAEICDGLDNDCNGIVDDGFPDSNNDGQADCVDPDDDGDGAADGQDCKPLDPLSSAAPPAEILDLVFVRAPDRSYVMTWTGQGEGLHYDLAGGLMSQLLGDRTSLNATCVPGGNDLVNASFVDARPAPPRGDAYYYIVRSQSSFCGSGTYGYASSGVERLPASACP